MDIEKVARLARPWVVWGRKKTFGNQLSKFLPIWSNWNQLDTTGVEPTSHAIPSAMFLEQDEVKASYPQEEVLTIAPDEEVGILRYEDHRINKKSEARNPGEASEGINSKQIQMAKTSGSKCLVIWKFEFRILFLISKFGFRILWSTDDLHSLTIHQLHDLLVKKEVTSREATEAVYQRIRQVEEKIKAYLLLTEEEAFPVRLIKWIARLLKEKSLETLPGFRRPERHPLHERNSNHLCLEDSTGIYPILWRDSGKKTQGEG